MTAKKKRGKKKNQKKKKKSEEERRQEAAEGCSAPGGAAGRAGGTPGARSIPGGNLRGKKLARGFPSPASSQGKIKIIISKWDSWRGCSRQRRSRFIDGTAGGTAEPAAGQGSPGPAGRAAASPGVSRVPPHRSRVAVSPCVPVSVPPPGKPLRGSPARLPRSLGRPPPPRPAAPKGLTARSQ